MLLIWVTGSCGDNTKTGIVERTRFEGKMKGLDLNFSRSGGWQDPQRKRSKRQGGLSNSALYGQAVGLESRHSKDC